MDGMTKTMADRYLAVKAEVWDEEHEVEALLNMIDMEDPRCARKIRLVLCAWCREVWGRLEQDGTREVVEKAELFADGLIDNESLVSAYGKAVNVPSGTRSVLEINAAFIGDHDAGFIGRHVLRTNAKDFPIDNKATLLRNIFGNPFRGKTCPRCVENWLRCSNGVVYQMAATIYDERAFDQLPILADALEEAGCTEQNILTHCRTSGSKYRGDWAIDLLLGKE